MITRWALGIFLLSLLPTLLFSYPQEMAMHWSLKNKLPFIPKDIVLDESGKLWLLGKEKVAWHHDEKFEVLRIEEKKPNTLFASKQDVFMGGSQGLWKLQQDKFVLQEQSPKNITLIDQDLDDRLWVVADNVLCFSEENSWRVFRKIEAQVRAMDIWGAKQGAVATDLGVWLLKGKRHYFMEILQRSGGLLAMDVKGVQRDQSGHLYIASKKGLNIYDLLDGWITIDHKELPCAQLTSLDLAKDGTIWLGSEKGVMRFQNNRWDYFCSRRWLLDDHVIKVVSAGNKAYVLTSKGISVLYQKTMTLQEKSQIYAERIKKYHKRFGYVMARGLSEEGDMESGKVAISDNDGLWTSLYIAAQSFRYAELLKTDPEQAQQALQEADESLDALIFLQTVTGIPGFPARAVRHKSEPEFGSENGEWRKSSDGEWEWKGDTSSDETAGHYFALFVAYRHLPEAQQKKVQTATKNMTDHVIDHGLTICDIDGKPTTWGVWGPDHLNRQEMWFWEKGLNSLEILSHLKAAHYITQEPRYQEKYRELIEKHHYALNIVHQKIVEPYQVYHDTQLAYLSYYPLLILEEDIALRRLYLMSLKNTFKYIRQERCPLWNFINCLFIEDFAALHDGIKTLQEIPMDLISWRIDHSHRQDIAKKPKNKWNDENLATTPLSYIERPVSRWDSNPYRLEGGKNGKAMVSPTIFLLPYWLARYHDLLTDKN